MQVNAKLQLFQQSRHDDLDLSVDVKPADRTVYIIFIKMDGWKGANHGYYVVILWILFTLCFWTTSCKTFASPFGLPAFFSCISAWVHMKF